MGQRARPRGIGGHGEAGHLCGWAVVSKGDDDDDDDDDDGDDDDDHDDGDGDGRDCKS